MPICYICNQNFPSIQALHIHYKISHNMRDTSPYMCSEQSCLLKKSFSSWSRMRRHYRCHHNLRSYSIDDRPLEQPNAGLPEGNPVDFLVNQNLNLDHPGVEEIAPVQDNLKDLLTRQAARFLSKLYACPSFPRNVVHIVVDGMTDFLESAVGELQERFESIVDNTVINEENNLKEELSRLLKDLTGSFSELSSDYLRLNYFSKSGNLVPAIDCKVGERFEHKFRANRIIKVSVPCNAKLLSLQSILRKFFSLPGNLSTVLDYMEKLKSTRNVLYNFIQGDLWRKKSASYEAEGKAVLPLFLGVDDLEINNALGSHTGVNELGAVYATIPCLPPEFYSRLDYIFLVYLYHSQDRKAFGNKEIFSYLIRELNYLAREGIIINTESGEKRVFFVLGLILGDNKGLNEILGFSGSFSANYFCRFCKRHKDDCASDFEEKYDFLRKTDDYDKDVAAGLQSAGVTEKSVWLDVDHFHPFENYAACTLHDFDEGICRYGMTEICHYFIKTVKVFSLEFLNDRMKGFNYQVNGFSNKPPEITEDQLKNLHFRMSGSEMRTFVLCFNHLVGDYVPLKCDVWKYYLILRRLVEFVACRSFPKLSLVTFNNLVKQHNITYVKLFGSLKPKMHILIHYYSILVQSGPMPYLSMIRNEGKHKEIKESASVTNSRKNVTHTFALKQQLKLCHLLMSGEGMKNQLETGRSEIVENIQSIQNYDRFSDTLPNCFKNDHLTYVKWVTQKGTTYKEGMCVILDLCNDGIIPCFGIIWKILIHDSEGACFVCRKLLCHGYDSSMGAYEVNYTEEWTCSLIDNLLSPFPAIFSSMDNRKFFASLRSKI